MALNETDTFKGLFDFSNESDKKSQVNAVKSQLCEANTQMKKAGRPRSKKENKCRYTFTLHPSVCEQAAERALIDGMSMSELIEMLLQEYIE